MYQLHIKLGCHSFLFTNAELNEISHLQQSTTITTIKRYYLIGNSVKTHRKMFKPHENHTTS